MNAAKKALTLMIAAGAIGTCLAGCLGYRCGPDEEFKDNMCVPAATDGGPIGDGGTPADNDLTGLGELCVEHDDCSGQADLCVVMPGHSTGYCTLEECSLDPDDCPAGYFCMDVSIYDPSRSTICIKE